MMSKKRRNVSLNVIFRHETLVNIHFSVTQCDTNYLVLQLLSALFLSVSLCKYFHVCVCHDLCSLSNVSITVSPSAFSLDVVPSVLRYLLAIKNCFYWLIKCFYFHPGLFCVLVVMNGICYTVQHGLGPESRFLKLSRKVWGFTSVHVSDFGEVTWGTCSYPDNSKILLLGTSPRTMNNWVKELQRLIS